MPGLKELFPSPPLFDDEEKTRIASLLHSLLLSAMVVAVLLITLAIVVYESLLPVGAAVLMIAAWYGMLFLLHQGRLQRVKVLSLLAFWLVVTAMAVVYAGLHGPAVVTYLIVIFAAGLILGARAGSVFAALSLLSVAGMLWAETRGLMPVGLVEPTPRLVWAGLTANLVLAALFVYLVASNINQALAHARHQQKALTESHKGLEAEIAERIRVEKALRESEAWLLAIVEGTHALLVEVDTEGRLTYTNDAVARTLGQPIEALQGIPYQEIIHPEDRERVRQTFNQEIRVDAPAPSLEFRLLAADDRPIWVRVAVHPMLDGEEVTGHMAVAVDISDRVAAEEVLRGFTRELQVRNEELDAFAHTVAHDLQNPLSLVVGFADVLLDEVRSMPEDVLRQHLGIIAESGRKMSKIIENLLLLAQVRRDEVLVTPLNMPAIVEEARVGLAYLIEEQRAEISVPESFPSAQGYGPWVEEVWANYLANAIEYGGRPPRIEIGAHPLEDGMVSFWIRDNGCGFAPEQHVQLFVPFARLNAGSGRGVGLGLSIVQRIIEKLGGQVGADSAGPGQGSTFFFTLPEA